LAKWFAVRVFCKPFEFMKVDQRPMLGEPWRANCKFQGS